MKMGDSDSSYLYILLVLILVKRKMCYRSAASYILFTVSVADPSEAGGLDLLKSCQGTGLQSKKYFTSVL